MMRPTPVRIPPSEATTRGPSLSWSRPAGIIITPNTAMASVYGIVAWVFVQPKPPLSTVSTSCFEKTDHAYRIPRARFSPIPAIVTIQPLRFMASPLESGAANGRAHGRELHQLRRGTLAENRAPAAKQPRQRRSSNWTAPGDDAIFANQGLRVASIHAFSRHFTQCDERREACAGRGARRPGRGTTGQVRPGPRNPGNAPRIPPQSASDHFRSFAGPACGS